MTLSTGTRLGPYEIVAPIGAGGMGEVYKAHDARLNRDVAIKISSEKFTERFEREAKSIAALNHPNICHLYDVGANYLVMELIAGERLAGPLPIETALDYARQIAAALEAAHERGIVHRDLKPANIMITPGGIVKVLDFGLAKNAEPSASDPEVSPTMTISPTQAGVILGTAAYMSPEQARGKPVDRRTDIWAFGVVFYEMLSGRHAFCGETVTDILASVVKTEPDWGAVPSTIQRLLRRCLEKDPQRRLRDIGDFELLLEEPAPATARRSKLPWGIAVLAAGPIAIALGVGWWRPGRAVERQLEPLIRFDIEIPRETFPGFNVPVISPDGSRIVYLSQGRLFSRRLDDSVATEIPGTQGVSAAPFFSPDSQWIAFRTDVKLKKTRLDGGIPMDLSNDAGAGSFFGGASWGSEGIVASLGTSRPMERIPSEGGASSPLIQVDHAHGETSLRWPQALPSGRGVLFTALGAPGSWDLGTIEVLSFRDNKRKTVYSGGSFGRYVPSGHLVFVRGGALYAVPFDLDRLETKGTPVQVIQPVNYYADTGYGAIDFASSSPGGIALYRQSSASGEYIFKWIGVSGESPLPAKPESYQYPRLSPDGERLAVIVRGDLYIYEMRREIMTRMTFNGEARLNPVWTPDGHYLVFGSSNGISWIRSNGAGKPEALLQAESIRFPISFSPNGKVLVFDQGRASASSLDVLTLPVETDGAGLHAGRPETFLNSRFNERDGEFSPDGRWIAYFSDESGVYEAYVRSYPDRGDKWQISNGGGNIAVWSRTANDLIFRDAEGRMMAAKYTVKGDQFIAEKPRPWADIQLPLFNNVGARHFDLAPDGKRLVATMPTARDRSNADDHIVFLINFFDELRRRVPTK